MDPSDGVGEHVPCFAPLNAGNICSEDSGDERAIEANSECVSARTDEAGGICKDAIDGCRSEEVGQCLGGLKGSEESLNFKMNERDGASMFARFDEEIDLPGENGTVEGSNGFFCGNVDTDSGEAPAEIFTGNGKGRRKNDAIAALDGTSDVVAEGGGVVNGWHETLDFSSKDHCTRDDEVPASSCPSLGFGSGFLNDWRGLDRCVSAASKGFAIGAGIKGGLALFGILGRLKRRSSAGRMAAIKTNSEAISAALKETLRYGLFLGTFAGTFTSVDEAIAALGGRTRTARWRAFLAGGVAGPSMLLTGLNTQHTSLAIYILMRAAVLASRCGIKSDKFGSLCKPLTWSYGDIFLMCLSSSQILSAYILKQDSLPSSYKAFLNKHGGKDPLILNGVKELVSSVPSISLGAIEKYYKSAGIDIKLDPTMKIPCSIVHGNQSCAAHAISFLFQAYARSFPVYLPVYFIPALIVHRRGLLKEPCTILRKGLLGTARSSLFLSVYCTSAWMWTCVLFQAIKRCDIPTLAIGTFPAGLALRIEKKSRRMEIALYCFARALESFFSTIADSGLLPHARRMKRVDVIIFSLSTAIIMHSYAQERDVFRSKYLNVLDWVFGVPHATDHPSNKVHSDIHMPQKREHVS